MTGGEWVIAFVVGGMVIAFDRYVIRVVQRRRARRTIRETLAIIARREHSKLPRISQTPTPSEEKLKP